MSHKIWRLSLFILFLTLFVAMSASAQNKRVVWNRFDVDIAVHEDGTFDVVEKQEVSFNSGPFTYGFRDISTRNTESITDVRISDGVRDYVQSGSAEPGTYYVEYLENAVHVEWHFDETFDDVRTFYISYKVHGGLRIYDEGDQLWWRAVYDDRVAEALSSVVTVKVPAQTIIEKAQAYFVKANVKMLDEHTVQFTAKKPIPPEIPFEVRVQFTHGVIPAIAPAWQAQADAETARQERQSVIDLFTGLLGLMVIILTPVILYLVWYLWGRDPQPAVMPTYLPEPPSSLRPALASVLVDEVADIRDVMATVMDLARRGYLSIQEIDRWDAHDYVYIKQRDADDSLLPYEAAVLDSLFNTKNKRKLSDMKNEYYQSLPAIYQKMYQELIKDGYVTADPNRVRNRWAITAGVLFFALIGIFFCLGGKALLAHFTRFSLLLIAGPLIFTLGMLVLANFMPKRTRKGADEAAKWVAFKTYLKELNQHIDLKRTQALFERYLPYATAFGLADDYLKMWETVKDLPTPVWYGSLDNGDATIDGSQPGHVGPAIMSSASFSGLAHASSGVSAGLSSMSTGMATMLTTASHTMSSRPASHSSSGGFSGGGSSGGGGGGGGGGGFG